MERFQVTTDKVLGPSGRTQASLTVKRYAHFSAGVFAGAVDYTDDAPTSRGGFAAFRTLADERPRDLGAFAALETRVKTDGRGYIFNLKCAGSGADLLWQVRLVAPPGVWTTLAFPFADMVLTRRGRVEATQHAVECVAARPRARRASGYPRAPPSCDPLLFFPPHLAQARRRVRLGRAARRRRL